MGAALIRPACFNRIDQGWECPSPDEIRAYLTEQDLTERAAARLMGIEGTDANAARLVRRYKAGERPIPYHAWRLLVLELRQPLVALEGEAWEIPEDAKPALTGDRCG